MTGMLRQVVHKVVYRLYAGPAMARVDHVTMFGLALEVPPTVFHPAFSLTSRFLGRYLLGLELRGKRLLDMGCGSGIQGLIAARRGADVTAVDINPVAAAGTRSNASANHLAGSIRAVEANLFDGMAEGELYDYIVWNPPFFAVDPSDIAARAWNAGGEFEVIAGFAHGAGAHLAPGGKIVIVLSSDADSGAIRGRFAACGFREEVARLQRRFFETLSIIVYSREQAP
ncbi:MAG TPA: methyltransferase [Bacteroidota bacterium]